MPRGYSTYFDSAAAVEVVAADEEVDVTSRRPTVLVTWASGTSMLRRRLSDGWARAVAARRAEKRMVMVE